MVGEEEGTSRPGNGYRVLNEKGELCDMELWEPCEAELGAATRVGELSLLVAAEGMLGLIQNVPRRY